MSSYQIQLQVVDENGTCVKVYPITTALDTIVGKIEPSLLLKIPGEEDDEELSTTISYIKAYLMNLERVAAVKREISSAIDLNDSSTLATSKAVHDLNEKIDQMGAGGEVGNHASATKDYGIGTSLLYGHVKLSDVYESRVTSGDADNGVAASQNALYKSYDALLTKIGSVIADLKNHANVSASTKTSGHVTIGDNITLQDGKVSLTKENVTSALGYTPIESVELTPGTGISIKDGMIENTGVINISESAENGKIKATINGEDVDVVVHGLKSAAYTDVGDYSKAAHEHDHIISGDRDNRKIATTPNDYNSMLKNSGLRSNDVISNPDTSTYSGVVGYRGSSNDVSSIANEFAFTALGRLFRRTGTSTEWNNWLEIIDSGNIEKYVPSFTGDGATGDWNITAAISEKLKTAREILVNLGSTNSDSFDGSKNVEPGITGTLPIANGGTGASTAIDAQNAILANLPNVDGSIIDTDKVLFEFDTPGGRMGTLYYKKASTIWDYVKSKIESVLKITATEYSGNAATATKLKTARKLTVDLASSDTSSFDGSKDISTGVSGVLPMEKGGTGVTTAIEAQNLILANLPNIETDVSDDSKLLFEFATPGGENGTIYYRKSVKLWQYIQAKIRAELKLTATEYGGNAASATKLKTARKINGTDFSGTEDITTETWGISRGIAISDCTETNISSFHQMDGSDDLILHLPDTIDVNIHGGSSNASTLTTGRKINVDLETSASAVFDGSEDISTGVSGVLPIEKGGTGATSAIGAQKAILASIDDALYGTDGIYYINDTAKMLFKYDYPAADNSALYSVKASSIWDYINRNISSVLKLTATEYSGNATSATKLKDSRIITLADGASSKGVSFNGASNAEIPVSDLKEAYLSIGGKNLNGYSALDTALIEDLSANRLAFIPTASITIEYSRDGGSTWTTQSFPNTDKSNLFNGIGTTLYMGNSSVTGVDKSKYKTRVTIDMYTGGLYAILSKFAFFISTNGSYGCSCTLYGQYESDYEAGNNVWQKKGTMQLTGWSGWNIMNPGAMTTYGSSSAKTSQFRLFRFEFGIGSINTSYSGLIIMKILGFGGMCYTCNNNLARYGRPYTYDSSLNVTFPHDVTAEHFVSNATKKTSTDNLQATYTTASKMFTCPTDGYVLMTSGNLTSGYMRVAICDAVGAVVAYMYHTITGTYQCYSIYVKKGMKVYCPTVTSGATVNFNGF